MVGRPTGRLTWGPLGAAVEEAHVLVEIRKHALAPMALAGGAMPLGSLPTKKLIDVERSASVISVSSVSAPCLLVVAAPAPPLAGWPWRKLSHSATFPVLPRCEPSSGATLGVSLFLPEGMMWERRDWPFLACMSPHDPRPPPSSLGLPSRKETK